MFLLRQISEYQCLKNQNCTVSPVPWTAADAMRVSGGMSRSAIRRLTWRLRPSLSRLLSRPMRFAGPVKPAPESANNFVTFGSFNTLQKLNDQVLKLWAGVLRAVPGAESVGVDGNGVVDLAGLERALAASGAEPALVSVMLANNETGVLQDVAALARAARAAGAWFHTDAVQALGKVAVDFRALGVHAMTLSAHKIGGPLGAGALVLDKRVELAPLIAGGGQERGLRSGTENVAAIVGFGVACERAVARREGEGVRLAALRDELCAALAGRGARIFSAAAPRLPNTVFFAVEDIDGETLVGRLDRAGFACASGSACSSANPEPSRTLLAMGVERGLARAAVRVSLGRDTRADDVRSFIETFVRVTDELKNLASIGA